MQRFDLSNLQPGTEGKGAICLRERQDRQTRDGKPYLVLKVGNATGQSDARVWAEGLSAWEGIASGDALHIHARVKTGFRGGEPELEILSATPLPPDHPVRLELNPVCSIPREELRMRLHDLMYSIRRGSARWLLKYVLESDAVGYERYLTAPAAKMHHHAYIGGLAEHSLEVAYMALALADNEPYECLIDRDSVIAGAIVHDLGKLIEYEYEGTPIGISRRGRLRSHVSQGSEIVTWAMADTFALKTGMVLRSDYEHVCHVIESHHGQLEWGAPTPPRTLEAMLIHVADLASARLRPMADGLADGKRDAHHWAEPAGWKREPVWHLRAAIEAEAQKRTQLAEADLEPLPWESDYTQVLRLTHRGGDDE